MCESEGHAAVAGLQEAMSRCSLAREPWSQALVLLMETVEKQSYQIRRLEGIVAADSFGDENDPPGAQHTPTSRAMPLARALQDNRQHVQELQINCAALQQQQKLASGANKKIAGLLQQLELRVQLLEHQQQAMHQQIELPSRITSTCSPSTAGLNGRSSPPASTGLRHGRDRLPAASATEGSIAVRVMQLEHQVHCLAETAADAQERARAVTSAVSLLEEKVNKKLSNIRTDTKQAITVAVSVASNTLKAELQADIDGQAKDRDQQMKQGLKGVSEQWDANLNRVSAAINSSCSAEVNTRLTAALDSQKQRYEVLQQQLNRLREEKADVRLLTQHIKQMHSVIEQLSVTLIDGTQVSITELIEKQQQLTSTIHGLSATKADHGAVLQLQQQCQQQVAELYDAMASAQQAALEANDIAAATKRATEPVTGLRHGLADTQGAVTALQAAVAGVTSCSEGHSIRLQEVEQQLQRLGCNQQTLQQQLIALTNQIDPAAAAVLAAAAAGNEDVTAVTKTKVVGSVRGCNNVLETAEAAKDGVVSHERICSNSTSAQLSARHLNTTNCLGQQQPAKGLQQHDAASTRQQSSCAAEAVEYGVNSRLGDLAGGIATRHLPLAMRLCLLEGSLQELSTSCQGKASIGDLAGLVAEVQLLTERSSAISHTLQAVNSSSGRQLEEQLTKFKASVADAIAERPSSTQVHAMMQQLTADAKQSATAAALSAGQAAVGPLQQQLQETWVELETAKDQLAAAQQELSKIRQWQAAVGDLQPSMQLQLQQLTQQVVQQLQEDQHSLQKQMERSIKTAASAAVKDLMATQAAFDSSASKHLSELSTLSDQVTTLTGQVARLDQQAAGTIQLQGQHAHAIAALETAIPSHMNQCEARAAAQQQQQQQQQKLQQELTAALQDCQHMHDARLASLESAAKEQATAVSDIAGIVAGLPSKAGIRDAVLAGTKATAEAMLQEHKQEEEQHWEVWLPEFARALEVRPTDLQLEQQLDVMRQQLKAVQLTAADSISNAVAKALAAAMSDGMDAQLKILDIRVDALEEGLHCSAGANSNRMDPPTISMTATAASEPAAAAGQMAVLLQQMEDIQLQLLCKADEHKTQLQFASLDARYASKASVEEQVQRLKQQVLGEPSGLAKDEQVLHLIKQHVDQGEYVTKYELDNMLQKKLDIDTFLASVAARRCAAVS